MFFVFFFLKNKAYFFFFFFFSSRRRHTRFDCDWSSDVCSSDLQFIVLGERVGTCCGGVNATGASYLGPEHAGVELEIDPENPLPFAFPGSDIYQEEQKKEFGFIQQLDRL